MPSSAFRNLVNTQYYQEIQDIDSNNNKKTITVRKLVAKAYLTYEEVFRQMLKDFCDEEANTFMAMLSVAKFPTREEQAAEYDAKQLEEAKKRAEIASKAPKVTVEELMRVNNIKPKSESKPIYWTGNPVQ